MNFLQQRLLALQGWYNRQKQDPQAQRMGQQLQMMSPGGTIKNVALKGVANYGDDIARYAMKMKNANRERQAIQSTIGMMDRWARNSIMNQRGTNMLSKAQQYLKATQQNSKLLNEDYIRNKYFFN